MTSTDAAVARLKAALPSSPDPHEVVSVRVSDLALLVADMPCRSCVFVQNTQDQAAVIRNLWETIDQIHRGRAARADGMALLPGDGAVEHEQAPAHQPAPVVHLKTRDNCR
jgi:hypothetical protein